VNRKKSESLSSQKESTPDCESDSKVESIYHYENFRSMPKSRKSNKIKMAEFCKISTRLREICLN